MKEMTIKVPEDAVEFVEELVERIGGSIGNGVSTAKTVKKSNADAQPFDFFGTWADIPLDPKTYRKEAWRKPQG